MFKPTHGKLLFLNKVFPYQTCFYYQSISYFGDKFILDIKENVKSGVHKIYTSNIITQQGCCSRPVPTIVNSD